MAEVTEIVRKTYQGTLRLDGSTPTGVSKSKKDTPPGKYARRLSRLEMEQGFKIVGGYNYRTSDIIEAVREETKEIAEDFLKEKEIAERKRKMI